MKQFLCVDKILALAIILTAFVCFKSTGNMLEGYVLPQNSAQYDIYGRKREQ